MTPNERLGRTAKRIMNARGWSSPEDFTKSFAPAAPPLSASVLRRIIDGKDAHLDGEAGEMKLIRLSVAFRLPAQTLGLVYAGNRSAIESLSFDGEDSMRQFVLDSMSAPAKRQRKTS